MTPNTPLPEATRERIKTGIVWSKSNYIKGSMDLGLPVHSHAVDQRGHGYHEGATTEATYALKLVEALEKVKLIRYTGASKQEMEDMFIAVEKAITEYNSIP